MAVMRVGGYGEKRAEAYKEDQLINQGIPQTVFLLRNKSLPNGLEKKGDLLLSVHYTF